MDSNDQTGMAQQSGCYGQSTIDPLTRQVRLVLTLGTALAYARAYPALDRVLDNSTGILATVPVFVAARLFGLRGGLLAGLLAFPLSSLLVMLSGTSEWVVWLRQGGALGTGALLLVGTVVGCLVDLSEKWKAELIERKRAEEELQQSEERFRKIFNYSVGPTRCYPTVTPLPPCCYFCDPSDDIVVVSYVMSKVLQVTRDRAVEPVVRWPI